LCSRAGTNCPRYCPKGNTCTSNGDFSFTKHRNIDIPGNDIKHTQQPNEAACLAFCNSFSNCRAIYYSSGQTCYTKTKRRAEGGVFRPASGWFYEKVLKNECPPPEKNCQDIKSASNKAQFCVYQFEGGNTASNGVCEPNHLKSSSSSRAGLQACYTKTSPSSCQGWAFSGVQACYWNKGNVMIAAGRDCPGLDFATHSGKTLDECEQLCSESDLCERFRYGRVGTSKNNVCGLLKAGCKMTSSSEWNLYWPKVKVIEHPSTTDKVCSHLDIYQKTKAKIDFCKTLKTMDTCRPKATIKYKQKFGNTSKCSGGGTSISAGTGFNEWQCYEKCLA
jgi:hypothetical protein